MFTLATTIIRPVLTTLAIAVLGAGCGGAAAAPSAVVRIDAATDGSLRFQRSSVEAPAGRVAVEMTNSSSIPHAIELRGPGVTQTGRTVTGGGRSRVEAQLKPGRYTLVCPVAGHEQAGMTATLIVR